MARVFKTGITAEGNLTTSGKLFVNASAGDEGGEIFLNKPVTNTSISGGVNIDVYQNKLRIWEDSGTNRGVYIDMTTAGAGVGTNLLGTATDTNYYPSTIVFNAGTTAGPTLDLTMSGAGAPDLTAVAIPSASDTASGIVTTGSQTFAGTKTFSSTITGSISGNAGTVTNGVYTTDTSTVTNTMLAGSIANAKLSNSSITVNGSAISLGGSVTTPNTFPTTWAWTGGTSAGPTASITGTSSTISVAAVPAASDTASGIVTTGAQTFGGSKTFSSSIDTPGIARTGASSLALSTANQSGSAGHITLTAGNSTTAGSGGNITLEVGTTAGAGSAGVISIGNTNTPQAIYIGTASSTISVPGAISVGGGFGSAGVTISTTGNIQADGTLAVGGGFGDAGLSVTAAGTLTTNSTISADGFIETGGSLRRTALTGSTTGATFDTNGNLIRTTSSARYKEDIQDATYSYEDILSLTPKTFKIKEEVAQNENPKTYGGFIAEDVDQIEGLRVFVNYTTLEDNSVVPDGINYGEMVSALVSALKHQDSRIKALEAQVQALSE